MSQEPPSPGGLLLQKMLRKTEAYQANHNLLISPSAKAYAQPQLEIYADDVKCSHGATSGRLDENALFYMRSRGIGAARQNSFNNLHLCMMFGEYKQRTA
jgi:Fe-S cluster assembly scaffold protein SufB